MDSLAHDVRLARRSLARSRGFATIAVLSLALGIAACTTIFSALDALILRALPFPGLDRLVSMVEVTTNCRACSTSAGDFATLRREARSLSHVAASIGWTGTIAREGGAERITGYRVTPGFFALLGARPALGRTFDADSAAGTAPSVVVLSDRMWRARFAGDPSVVGRAVTLNGLPYTVVGVMPPRFALGAPGDVWLPLVFTAQQERDFLSHGWSLLGRLAPGVSMARAQEELGRISARINAAYPDQSLGMRLVARTLSDDFVGQMKQMFVPLLGGVAFVLLIVCANIANLSLARASDRQREIALRAALGASRWRIARQLLAESAVVATLGAALGVLLAWVAVPLLRSQVPASFREQLPGWETLAVDVRAVAFTIAVGAVSALLFGGLPALRASRTDLAAALAEGSRGSTSGRGGALRRGLVVAELALALVLLAGGALVMRSLARLVDTDTGFHAERTLTMALQVPGRKYRGAIAAATFNREVREAIEALPGGGAVGGTWNLPLSGTHNFTQYDVAGRAPTPLAQQPSATDAWVTPGYFAALGIAVLRGRDFTARDDTAAAPVVVVSEAFARKVWPGREAIGQVVITNGRRYDVVGVAADVRNDGVEAEAQPAIYRSIEQVGGIPSSLVVRTSLDPVALTSSIRRALAAIDRDAAIADVRAMPQVVSEYLTPWRLLAILLGAFAAMALAIAAIGIYGVMAYAVAQRTQEIGIRMALGADRGSVLGMVLRQAASLVVAGVAFGAVGVWGTSRVLAFLLYQVSARDPLVLGGVSALLALVALAAAWVPARRATRVDPMVALRAE